MTVSLSNPALCGAPAAIPFFGQLYTQLDVSSNGRVMFGSPAPNTSFTPTAAAALTSYPFVGPWCDLAPNLAGSIAVSVPGPNLLRVDWTGVRYFAVNATATFGIQFDATIGSVQIDDQMYAGAAHAVAHGEVPFATLRGCRLHYSHVSQALSGGAWRRQALPRSQEGVLAHWRPPQPSDPTRVPINGAKQANAADQSARGDRSQRPAPT